MDKNDKVDKKIEKEASDYAEYFKEDLDAINDGLAKLDEYAAIVDAEIKKLSAPGLPTKGSQHYLIEHITNAVQLQMQRQGLRKDRVAIKKLILDYTNKQLERKSRESSNGDSNAELMESLKRLLESDKHKVEKPKASQVDLDSEIDNILEATDKDGD